MRRDVFVLATIVFLPVAAFAQTYSFTTLDSVISGTSARAAAMGVSGNGLVVGGGDSRIYDGEQPFIWRKINGSWIRSELPVPTGSVPQPQNLGRVMSLSYDGDTVSGSAGHAGIQLSVNYGLAAVWTNVLSGTATLQVINAGGVWNGLSNGIAADGSPALLSVGISSSTPPRAVWRWEVGTTVPLSIPEGLGLASTYDYFGGQRVSADGSTLVFRLGNTSTSVAIKNRNGQNVQLATNPNLYPGFNAYSPTAVDESGEQVAGQVTSSLLGAAHAVWWDAQNQIHALARPSGTASANYSMATGMSVDGKVIVGLQYNSVPVWTSPLPDYNSHATIWVNGTPRRLIDVLIEQGVNVGTVIPLTITGISHDGSTIVGYGRESAAPSSPLVSFVATILPPGVCDDIDFNRDGSRFDPMDINAFLSVYSEGPCLPAGAQCRDIDFNNDGSLFDPRDIEAFLSVFSEGPCL